jgi:hypothetical protein
VSEVISAADVSVVERSTARTSCHIESETMTVVFRNEGSFSGEAQAHLNKLVVLFSGWPVLRHLWLTARCQCNAVSMLSNDSDTMEEGRRRSEILKIRFFLGSCL